MSEKRHYHVVIGSRSYFDSIISKLDCKDGMGFLEIVRLWDYYMKQNKDFDMSSLKTPFLIIKNDNYHGIVDTAHDRLGGLIEDITTSDAEIYVHNPPQHLYRYLSDQKSRKIIEIETMREEYTILKDEEHFAKSISSIRNRIIGQDNAIHEVSKSLWYLTTIERKKPYVIMLYGNSSLGKTELVREIAANFFEGKYLEKHLSMFKNTNYSDYFFGDAPNRRSIGFDLLERESNLLFFDEIDKCPEHFYSAFYTLFDNTLFTDAYYEVDVSGAIIILTSNYRSIDEMKNSLGLPVFYRIDKLIHFSDFTPDVIYKIVMQELESRKEELRGKLSIDDIYRAVSKQVGISGENARTIKYKVQQVIEDLLFEEIIPNRTD